MCVCRESTVGVVVVAIGARAPPLLLGCEVHTLSAIAAARAVLFGAGLLLLVLLLVVVLAVLLCFVCLLTCLSPPPRGHGLCTRCVLACLAVAAHRNNDDNNHNNDDNDEEDNATGWATCGPL